jgi:hypothetical protein
LRNGLIEDEGDKKHRVCSVNSEFLSNYFVLVLEGISIPFPLGTIFCAERIQTNSLFS